MKNIIILATLIFISKSFAQPIPNELSTTYRAFKTWLGVATLEESKVIEIKNFDNYNYLSQLSLEDYVKSNGWNVKHRIDYNGQQRATPVVYKKIQARQGEEKNYVMISGYMFLEKEINGKINHLVIKSLKTSWSYDLFNPQIFFDESNKTVALEFVNGVKEYLTTKNFYKNAVIHREKINKGCSSCPKVFKYLDNVSEYNYQWDSLILDPKLKAITYSNTFDFVKRIPQMRKIGMDARKGIVLMGPPGTGKSFVGQIMISQILHGELKKKATMLVLTARHLNSISEVANVFNAAKELAPTVVFMEDIDLLGIKKRSADQKARNTKAARILNEMLNHMDGIADTKGLLFVGTTNKADSLDSALMRSGRLGIHYTYGLPKFGDRVNFFEVFAKRNAVLAADVDVIQLSGMTEGYSGADIIEIISMAKAKAFELDSWEGDKLLLTKAFFQYAIANFHGEKSLSNNSKSYAQAIKSLY